MIFYLLLRHYKNGAIKIQMNVYYVINAKIETTLFDVTGPAAFYGASSLLSC